MEIKINLDRLMNISLIILIAILIVALAGMLTAQWKDVHAILSWLFAGLVIVELMLAIIEVYQ